MDSSKVTIPSIISLIDWSHMLTVQVKIAANDKDLTDHNRAGRRALEQLHSVKSSMGPEGCAIVCLDSPPYWRKKIFDGYKGQRPEREPEYGAIMQWTLESIREDGFSVARAPGEESDDVIATLARIYVEMGCTDVRIVGADKDALQLVSERVRLFVPKERGEFDIRGPEWLLKNYNVKPSDFALLLAIMGDDSDNIGGIDGLGKGHGAKLINAYKDPAGMAKGLVAAQEAAQQPGAKPLADVWKKYAAGMAKLPFWLQLTTLKTDVALELPAAEYLKPAEPKLFDDSDFEDDAADFDPVALEPSAEELAEERARMAAELPVGRGPALSVGEFAQVVSDIQGAIDSGALKLEPMPDPAERRAAMAAEADRVFPSSAPKGAPATPTNTVVASGVAGGAGHDPSKMIVGADPKAREILASAAAERSSGSTAAPTAQGHSVHVAQGQTIVTTPAAPSAAGAANTPPSATPQAPAPQSSSPAAQVVPPNRGPQKPRQPRASDGIDPNALAVRVDTTWELSAQPSTAKEMMQIAETVFQSPMFRSFGTPYGTFAIIALGREMGFGWMQSLMVYYDVNGRPFMGAHAMRGKILAHPDCEFFVCTENTEQAATWVTRRKSWPKDVPTGSYRFTYAEAVNIGLTTGKNAHNWTKNSRSMIEKYASSHLARQVWADVIGGMHSPEEEH